MMYDDGGLKRRKMSNTHTRNGLRVVRLLNELHGACAVDFITFRATSTKTTTTRQQRRRVLARSPLSLPGVCMYCSSERAHTLT